MKIKKKSKKICFFYYTEKIRYVVFSYNFYCYMDIFQEHLSTIYPLNNIHLIIINFLL